MIVLGITDSFNSGAAVVIDGKVAAAVNEERLNRHKLSMGFPRLSIREVLRLSNVGPEEVDAVAIATENLFWRSEAVPYSDYFRESKGGARDMLLSLGATFSTLVGDSAAARQTYHNVKKVLTSPRQDKMKKALREDFGIDKPVVFIDHHLCHAASAYFTCGHQDATVITHDGAGDGKCSAVYRVKSGEFEELHVTDSYHSLGNYYAYVTHICGFKAHNHEGKITGLAAHGKPVHLGILREFLTYEDGIIENAGRCFDQTAIKKLLKALPRGFTYADLSASAQTLLEETISQFCDYWIGKSGIADVALAGGVFANVKLNQRIHELPSTREVFVHPGMGDDGLAVGAALHEENRLAGYRPQPVIQDVYLGAEFTEDEVASALQETAYEPQRLGRGLAPAVAKLLAEGKVVARFDGRMEYGPRALGNRSILYQPTDPSVNDWLNKRLSRTEFMPFAPVTLWEDRDRCYQNLKGAEETARFMTITFDCTKYLDETCPAVSHVDKTARPQLIRAQDNEDYYRIVEEYKKITGIPCVINTSFNMHEEPIVHTPSDAIRSFARGNLDALAIGPFLVHQRPD